MVAQINSKNICMKKGVISNITEIETGAEMFRREIFHVSGRK